MDKIINFGRDSIDTSIREIYHKQKLTGQLTGQ